MKELLKDLTHIVQYRRKETGTWQGYDPWHTMAAFDCEGAASVYCSRQGNETWEYRWLELPVSED